MRTSPRRALVAGLAATLALAACSTGGAADPSPDDTAAEPQTQDVTITVAHEQEFNAYNNSTSADNATKNSVVLNQVLTTFWEFGLASCPSSGTAAAASCSSDSTLENVVFQPSQTPVTWNMQKWSQAS